MQTQSYRIWGEDLIDPNAREQMDKAMALPPAVGGALMPDAHLGYGLPIGGVLALDNAVCPYAVGVDIACRMKLSVFDESGLAPDLDHLSEVIERNTFFGVGVENNRAYGHVVFDRNWNISTPTRENRDKALRQLGTSGSGNHFAVFGNLVVMEPFDGVPRVGNYLALITHSGSRGAGAAVCDYFSKLAKQLHPEYGELGWFDLDTAEGQWYWAAMTLMGDYAKANHVCIHNAIERDLGVRVLGGVENHHNFAWKEMHDGREVVVHRKGATPAGAGVLGVIPGSMGTRSYVVRGRGNPASLHSASHGAGRVMSRKQAKKNLDYKKHIADLESRGIRVLSAGVDEICAVYKDIDMVMAAQEDLVDVIATFQPCVVKMCGSGDKAED